LKTIALLHFIFFFNAYGINLPAGKLWKCEEKIIQILKQQNIEINNGWKESLQKNGLPIFKANTNKIAQWMYINKSYFDTESLVILNTEKKIEYHFNPLKGCSSFVTSVSMTQTNHGASELSWFTDKDLQNLLSTKPNGIIFVWSPHMSLSLKAVEELKDAVKELNLPITFLLDPQADQKLSKSSIQKYSMSMEALKRVDSLELSMRNALIHFPALILVKDGKICPKIQRGYRVSKKFKAIITDIMGSCNEK